MPSGKEKTVCQLYIVLLDIEPEIWRRFQVSSDVTLDRLHDVIQMVMGWQDYHLHQFMLENVYYGIPPEDPPKIGPPTKDERKARLRDIIDGEGDTFTYRYDFGDCWDHGLEVEKMFAPQEGKCPPACIAGARACPPEDCGGTMGYERLLESLRDPEHPEHERLLEWVGGSFDPEEFDIAEVKRKLAVFRQ